MLKEKEQEGKDRKAKNMMENREQELEVMKNAILDSTKVELSEIPEVDPIVADVLKDALFTEALRIKNLEIHMTPKDGNSLFRSVSRLVYGTEDLHSEVRRETV